MTYTFWNELTDIDFTLTHEQILQTQKALNVDGEVLAYTLTGLNCDTYADKVTDFFPMYESVEEAKEDDPDQYETLRAWHRILNYQLDDETCETYWLEAAANELGDAN